MKAIWISGFLALLLLGIAGCSKRQAADPHAGHGDEEGSVNFEAGKGVIFTRETMDSLGIQVVEVGERELDSVLVVMAQVYRSADETSSASGTFKTGHAYAAALIAVSMTNVVNESRRITIQMPNMNGSERSARLMRVDDSLKSATQTVEALLEIPDTSNSLVVGLSVKATFHHGGRRSVMAVPRSALLKTAEGNFVYTQNEKHLLRTPVQVGTGNADWVEIKDGLLEGDAIASNKTETLWLTELRATKGGGHCH